MDKYREIAKEMISELNRVILGKESFIFEVVAAVLANGHILLEDIPCLLYTSWNTRNYGTKWSG